MVTLATLASNAKPTSNRLQIRRSATLESIALASLGVPVAPTTRASYVPHASHQPVGSPSRGSQDNWNSVPVQVRPDLCDMRLGGSLFHAGCFFAPRESIGLYARAIKKQARSREPAQVFFPRKPSRTMPA